MSRILLCCIAAFTCCAFAQAAENNNQGNGDAIGKIVVDTAPGAVSATSMLGVGGDQTTVIQNPRDLTIALKALDGENSYGVAITPARTSLLPMNISTYYHEPLARLWASTTFSYAQGRVETAGKEYDRHAYAVETSYYFTDDPLISYWEALQNARGDNVCNIHAAPVSPGTTAADVKKILDERAQACRDYVTKQARWNATRAWASWASGRYKPATGGETRSLGRVVVVGMTLGIGGQPNPQESLPTGTAITLAAKRVSDSPLLESLGDLSPPRTSSTLAVLRVAYGTSSIRALLEGSNARDDSPTAASRTYKRALGIEAKLAEGLWLNFKAGKQRKTDNTGDENASSFSLSYSPKALLSL